jgi:DNA repair protein RecO (recombination protein O)
MLLTTKGIVLHSLKYSETSIIARIYTEASGLQSYLIKGIRSPRSKIKAGLFQPLTLLELVAYHNAKTNLHTAKEVHLALPYISIPFDIRKSSIALYINELVFKSIREEEANADLFAYLWNTCLLLDSTEVSPGSFPLVFTAELTRYLGILPLMDYSEQRPVFNLQESHFQAIIPEHEPYIIPEFGKQFSLLIESRIIDHEKIHLKPAVRRSLLESLLLFYRIHLPGFKPMNSHHVLHSVLS